MPAKLSQKSGANLLACTISKTSSDYRYSDYASTMKFLLGFLSVSDCFVEKLRWWGWISRFAVPTREPLFFFSVFFSVLVPSWLQFSFVYGLVCNFIVLSILQVKLLVYSIFTCIWFWLFCLPLLIEMICTYSSWASEVNLATFFHNLSRFVYGFKLVIFFFF